MTINCTKYTYSFRRDLQKLRHTSLLPGQFPGLTGQLPRRLAALVTQTPSIAVPLALINRRDNHIIDILAVTMTHRNHDNIDYNDCRFDKLIKKV